MKQKIHPCSQCGICCKLFLINLTKKEWETHWYDTVLKKFDLSNNYHAVQKYGGHILQQKSDGSCIYLRNNTCSIHTKRPQSCRNFFCTSPAKKFRTMVATIKERKKNDILRSC